MSTRSWPTTFTSVRIVYGDTHAHLLVTAKLLTSPPHASHSDVPSAAVKGALDTANAKEVDMQDRLGVQQAELQQKADELKELMLKQVHLFDACQPYWICDIM